jgi:2-polyprenyl-3-methyl-5-hydroxy-6-metoxy-1,4-benzoquinol methylase
MIDYERIRDFYERHRADQADDPDFLRSTVDEALGVVRFRTRAEARHLDRVLAIEPGDRVLDLGAGTGRWAVYFAEKGAHVTAIEIAPSLADVARRNADRRGVTLDYRVGSLLDPPLAAHERFDLVHLGGVLVYINDADLGRVRDVVVAHTQPSATLLLREPVDPHGPSEQERGPDYRALFRKPEAYVEAFTPAFRLLYERTTVSHLLPRGYDTQGVVNTLGKSAAWKRWLVDHVLPSLAFADYALLGLEERWRASALAGLLGDPGVLQHFYVFTRQA